MSVLAHLSLYLKSTFSLHPRETKLAFSLQMTQQLGVSMSVFNIESKFIAWYTNSWNIHVLLFSVDSAVV